MPQPFDEPAADCEWFIDANPISIPCSDSEYYVTEAELTIEEDASQRAWLFYNRITRKDGAGRPNLLSPTPDEERSLEKFMSNFLEEEAKLEFLAAAAQEDLVFDLEL